MPFCVYQQLLNIRYYTQRAPQFINMNPLEQLSTFYPCELSTGTVALQHTHMCILRHTYTQTITNGADEKYENDELLKFIVTVKHIFCSRYVLSIR